MGQICRICFKLVQDGKYEIIGEVRQEMFEVLLLKLNFLVCEETVICSSCIRQLDETFQFKATCLYTEDCIYPFIDQGGDTKLDMRQVYYKNDKQNVINIENDEDVCRLCMGVFHNNLFCTLEKTEKDMIQKYVPEVNMDATLKTLFCKTCVRSLTHNFSFIMKCLQTEEKIKSYRYKSGVCNISKIKLSEVIRFAKENENGVDNKNFEDLQCNIDDDVVTEDETEYSADDDNNLEVNISAYSKKVLESGKKEQHNKSLATSEKINYCEICQKQFKTQRILQKHIKNVHRNPSTIFSCDKCSLKSRYKYSIINHMMMHMDPSELKLLPCELCSYKTKRTQDLKKHLLTHNDYKERPKLKCPLCSYEVIHYVNLKNHMLIHKDDSEVTWYRCEKCPYKSEIQDRVRRHQLKHKNISEIKHFNCSLCSYKTNKKDLLRSHQLKHKNLSEIPTFNCYQCPYRAKVKGKLRRHISTCHQKDPKLYSCDKCNMTTKYVKSLKTHALIHKDKSETTMYGCDKCTFKTKLQHYLPLHKKIHSDFKPYKCEFCGNAFKRIENFRRHQLSHKSVNEVRMYKCNICSYQSKRKDHLGKHLKTHKN